MSQKPINLTLDTTTKRMVTDSSNIVRGDTLLMTISVYQSNVELDVTDQTIRLILTKPGGLIIEEEAIGMGNIITIELDEQATMSLGVVRGEIQLSDTKGVTISNKFIYLVDESLGTNVIKKSIDEIRTLVDMRNLIDEVTVNMTNLQTMNSSVTANLASLTTENTEASGNITELTNENANATANIEALTELINSGIGTMDGGTF